MRQMFATLLLALGFSLSAYAQTTTEHEVIKLEKEMRAALVKGDLTLYERHIANDYHATDSAAGLRTKDFLLQMLKGRKFERYDLDDLKVREYGEAAVVTGRFHRKGSGTNRQGKPFEIDSQGRFTSVWVKRDGRWQQTVFHQSEMPKQTQ